MAWNAPEVSLRERLISVLSSPAVQKINFRLANYQISWFSFLTVIGLLRTTAIQIVIDTAMDPDDDAEYGPREDAFFFSQGMYGLSLEEKAVMVHESVHAWIDYLGNGAHHRAVDNEAAAYVAEALYYLHMKQSVPDPDRLDMLTSDIAKKIHASKRAVPEVDHDDLTPLRYAVHKRGYQLRPRDPDDANRIASPFAVLPPLLYGLKK